MLFNSPEFLFVYLPSTLFLFLVLGAYVSAGAAATWLALASLAFYGWTDPQRLWPIIIASTAFNFVVGRRLARYHNRSILWFGVAANLVYLGYFKYSSFIITTLSGLGSLRLTVPELPLGISFFTFTQIAFLVDAYRREASEYKPIHYTLFVTFFPHLIAGPIIHHKEIMPQFADLGTYRFNLARFTIGLTWFGFGLAKKVLLADNVAGYATKVFTAAHAAPLALTDAWLGTVAYAMQIYFDFSGYSDMAIGLALMFGIALPLNFNSPYKSTSLIEFWRRWHMTLSRFLRDYLYIPLGGGRKGQARRYANLLVCMLLGGLWHGAGWNFVAWGALHGIGLATNHLWQDVLGKRRFQLPSIVGIFMTLIFVLVAWVPFRAESMSDAAAIWGAMIGFSTSSSGAAILDGSCLLWIGPMMVIALLMPNTQEVMQGSAGWLRWRPEPMWAAASGLAVGAAVAVILSGGASEFLYFKF
jgi:alginate O-acetyltransferase complex protein AlgI